MGLTTQLAGHFPTDVQNLGRMLYNQGKVDVRQCGQLLLRCRIKEDLNYLVDLQRVEQALYADCVCERFRDQKVFCEHIWAALLTAEAWGYLFGKDSTVPTTIQRGPAPKGKGNPGIGSSTPRAAANPRPPSTPAWEKALNELRAKEDKQPTTTTAYGVLPRGDQIVYLLDVSSTLTTGQLVLEVVTRHTLRSGGWSVPRSLSLYRSQISSLADPVDRQALTLLNGAKSTGGGSYYYYGYSDSVPSRYELTGPLSEVLMPLLGRSGRLLLRQNPEEEGRPISWDDGGPWQFALELAEREGKRGYSLTGTFRRGEEVMPVSVPTLILAGGPLFYDDKVAALDDGGTFEWISLLRRKGEFPVAAEQAGRLVEQLLRFRKVPRVRLPQELRYEEVSPAPKPSLKVRAIPGARTVDKLSAELAFDYDGMLVPQEQPGDTVYQASQRRLIHRDRNAESAAGARLAALGFKARAYRAPGDDPWELASKKLPKVVRELLAEGWNVEAEGKLYRRPGDFRIEVSSGIDWFDLHATVDFDGQTASLPELLAALRRGDNTVQLDDGTFGLLPEEWLKKFAPLAGVGTPEGDSVRFRRAQTGLLDALLAAQPEVSTDEVFEKARDELRSFSGVTAADPPAGFQGELRPYQKEGLGWLYFLEKFGFGGCLADDMGLGKTVQVLALLESRRQLRAQGGEGAPPPSLVVVPRSLVFNWKAEATRFTPQLRVLDYTTPDRTKDTAVFDQHDIVLATYGTLLRDVSVLKDYAFDYCILDEAQAVKNAASASAKAVRLIQSRQRLAMSGTPVQNHLGELWSLFDFLNPGMLGTASIFKGITGRNPDPETRELLARGLRPFILRRTKDQVAKDLPEKTEQTIYCELDAAQRRLYDELRDFYRASLLAKVDEEGMNNARMHVLEALLRLRQAACHPGLIDKKKANQAGAKLEALMPQLSELLEEGHKVLVFSQFTSFLALVRERLDANGVTYEYLDGQTRDRQERVERFQTDPDCKLFLISLKAGGLGLNLTAAGYVFLLDPWWNPAVEAQAIDRTHRIGQTKPVFAYRLIAKDTVEEKVLQLQQTKRELADAIINADNSLVSTLDRDDLELLLS